MLSNNSTPCKVAAVTTAGQTRALRGRRSMRPSGDDREQAILATAEHLLEARSFADISVDDLAKGAGLSRPTFYFYFKSKEAVLLSLLEPVIARADSEFDGAVLRLPADPRRVWPTFCQAWSKPILLCGVRRPPAMQCLSTFCYRPRTSPS